MNAADKIFRALAEHLREHGDAPSLITTSQHFDKELIRDADIHQWMNLDTNAPPRATFAGIRYAVLPEQVTEFMLEEA